MINKQPTLPVRSGMVPNISPTRARRIWSPLPVLPTTSSPLLIDELPLSENWVSFPCTATEMSSNSETLFSNSRDMLNSCYSFPTPFSSCFEQWWIWECIAGFRLCSYNQDIRSQNQGAELDQHFLTEFSNPIPISKVLLSYMEPSFRSDFDLSLGSRSSQKQRHRPNYLQQQIPDPIPSHHSVHMSPVHVNFTTYTISAYIIILSAFNFYIFNFKASNLNNKIKHFLNFHFLYIFKNSRINIFLISVIPK